MLPDFPTAVVCGLFADGKPDRRKSKPDKNMTHQKSRIILFAACILLTVGATSCCWICGSHSGIVIVRQPQDQAVHAGAKAAFTVRAEARFPDSPHRLSYQWQYNGTQLDGELYWTNLMDCRSVTGSKSAELAIVNVQVERCGFYRVLITGSQTKKSAPAELQLYDLSIAGDGGNAIAVYGTPRSSSGTTGKCPGKYYGVVKYSSGWTVADSTSTCAARDAQRTDTAMDYIGLTAGDPGCTNTSGLLMFKPVSTKYEFDVYFVNKPVATGQYLIYLTNFNSSSVP